jgi:hypothetical protein
MIQTLKGGRKLEEKKNFKNLKKSEMKKGSEMIR